MKVKVKEYNGYALKKVIIKMDNVDARQLREALIELGYPHENENDVISSLVDLLIHAEIS